MTREEIIAKMGSSAEALRAEGVTKLDLVGVEHIIEDATGLRAQATMRRSLEPKMAERIADDIIEVF